MNDIAPEGYTLVIPNNEIRDALFDVRELQKLVDKHGFQTSLLELRIMRGSLHKQIAEINKSTEDWRHRALTLYSKSIVAIEQIKVMRDKREIEPEQKVNAEDDRSTWSEFALDLAVELYQVAPSLLHQIDGPTGQNSAYTWARSRLKREHQRGQMLDIKFDLPEPISTP